MAKSFLHYWPPGIARAGKTPTRTFLVNLFHAKMDKFTLCDRLVCRPEQVTWEINLKRKWQQMATSALGSTCYAAMAISSKNRKISWISTLRRNNFRVTTGAMTLHLFPWRESNVNTDSQRQTQPFTSNVPISPQHHTTAEKIYFHRPNRKHETPLGQLSTLAGHFNILFKNIRFFFFGQSDNREMRPEIRRSYLLKLLFFKIIYNNFIKIIYKNFRKLFIKILENYLENFRKLCIQIL